MVILHNKENIIEETDSGLSFSEQAIAASYKSEKAIGRKSLKRPSYYKDRLFEIRDKLKVRIESGESAEECISCYIRGLRRRKRAFLTESLELKEGKVNCVSETALFISLAEMLNYKLFEDCDVGRLGGHIMVRKDCGGFFKNIDYGMYFQDSFYKDSKMFGEEPETKPKRAVIANILASGAGHLNKKHDAAALKFCDEALRIDPENTIALYEKMVFLDRIRKNSESDECYRVLKNILSL